MYTISMSLIELTCAICDKKYKMSSWYKGRRFCSNKCRGVELKNKGIKPPPRSGMAPWNKGLNMQTDNRLAKMSADRSGEKNWQWQHGQSKSHRTSWGTSIHKAWRKAVFERDNYTCQICFTRGGNIQADHIKCFAHNPQLRYVISNGRTLCYTCHQQTQNYGVHDRRFCV